MSATIYQTAFPECLRNAHDLQLGAVFLRNLGTQNLPSLTTIYELERPVILAYTEMKNMLGELGSTDIQEYTIKGIFTLGVARFEIMLADLMKTILQFFPEKIALIKNRDAKTIHVTQEAITKGLFIENIIENELVKLSYTDIGTLLSVFGKITSIELSLVKKHIDSIIEIKETSNLLLHNNLYVNDFYLQKAGMVKRSKDRGTQLKIDIVYARESLQILFTIIEQLILEIRMKFGKYTLLHLLKSLWRYTFRNPAIRMEDFCTINEEKDIIDGPFQFPGFLSGSEKTYMEFWKSQRSGSPVTNLSMVHLGSGRKLAFLADVFGELRLTHW